MYDRCLQDKEGVPDHLQSVQQNMMKEDRARGLRVPVKDVSDLGLQDEDGAHALFIRFKAISISLRSPRVVVVGFEVQLVR